VDYAEVGKEGVCACGAGLDDGCLMGMWEKERGFLLRE